MIKNLHTNTLIAFIVKPFFAYTAVTSWYVHATKMASVFLKTFVNILKLMKRKLVKMKITAITW